MNIIEKFYILFKSDASDVKRGADEAKKATTELDTSLKGINKNTEQTGKAFVELVKNAAEFLGIAVAVHKVLGGITEANNYALELGDASRALGVNAADLDAWGNVVKRTGGSVEGFKSSLKGLSEHFGSNAKVALAVLPKLADVFHRLGRFRALQYGKQLGLDESTILLLQQGRREVEDMIRRQKELGVVTEINTKEAEVYRNAQNDLDTAFRSLYLTLGQTVIPILTKFYQILVPPIEYLKQHKDLVIGAFIAIGAAAAVMLAPFIIANAAIIAVAAGIAALIGLFALVYEDVVKFTEGQKSLLGLILEKWPVVGAAVRGVIDEWKQRIQAFTDAFKYMIDLFDKVQSFFKGDNKVTIDVRNVQGLIGLAGASPIGAQSSTAMFNSRAFARNSSINTGDITINTQANDAVGISKALGKTLNDQFAQTSNFFADGVSM